MTLNDLIKTIHVSIDDANKMHMKWTGGWWVTAYGVESFIVGNIARGIMDLPNPPKYATMETKFSELYDNSGIRPKGPSRVASKSNNRLDLALYAGENLSHAIELKRFWDPKCLEDLDRLALLIKKKVARCELEFLCSLLPAKQEEGEMLVITLLRYLSDMKKSVPTISN